MMIKITKFETMRDCYPLTSLRKLRSLLLLEELELGWQAGLVDSMLIILMQMNLGFCRFTRFSLMILVMENHLRNETKCFLHEQTANMMRKDLKEGDKIHSLKQGEKKFLNNHN